MFVSKLSLRQPLVGEHVKVFGNRIVYEVVKVDCTARLVNLDTAVIVGDSLADIHWKRLGFLDPS